MRKKSLEDSAALILEAGIEAAIPSHILDKILKRNSIFIGKTPIQISKYTAVRIVSFGKAGLSMAMAFDRKIKAKDGIIVIPHGISIPKKSKFNIICSSHPNPSQDSIKAANAILSYIKKCHKDDLLVFLVSGGGSALVALPNGITLNEKIRTNELLLRSGANIAEINCVRKHLSKIKGGQMTSNLPCEAISLLMSDVKKNDMTSIASGMTYCDKTTFAQALKILKKYKIDSGVPKSIILHLTAGIKQKIPETPKKPLIKNYVIASNKNCINAMRKKAEKLGFSVKTTTVFGKVEKQALVLAKIAPTKKDSCVIFGGETTVVVKGNGLGGRNQEFVLHIASKIRHDVIIGSIGTDGIDGNTKYAGAMIHTSKIEKPKIKDYLKNNNSNRYFERYGGLIETGPTQTNLLDIGIILC